jgi:hypothetical protein
LVQWVIWFEELMVKNGLHAKQTEYTPRNWQAPNFTPTSILCKIRSLPIWGRISQRACENLPILGLSQPPLQFYKTFQKTVEHFGTKTRILKKVIDPHENTKFIFCWNQGTQSCTYRWRHAHMHARTHTPMPMHPHTSLWQLTRVVRGSAKSSSLQTPTHYNKLEKCRPEFGQVWRAFKSSLNFTACVCQN